MVKYLMGRYSVSVKKACRCVRLHQSAFYYQASRLADGTEALRLPALLWWPGWLNIVLNRNVSSSVQNGSFPASVEVRHSIRKDAAAAARERDFFERKALARPKMPLD